MAPGTDRLVLDIGNSRTKCGLFQDGRLVRHGIVANGDADAVRAMLDGRSPELLVVGSVARKDDHLMTALDRIGPVHVITGTAPSHLRSRYRTHPTLGADRWANAVGVSVLFPHRTALAISLGTCTTYDLVTSSGEYSGGIISPGYRMRARAMAEFTARLPEVVPHAYPPLIGGSTEECLASGTHHGLRSELLSIIREIRQQHPDLAVVLTGGDALRFARALENGIFAHPFLTLSGLHALSLFDRPSPGVPAP